MNRRGFVSMLFGGAVVVALPERRIFLPPRGGWRVADYLTLPRAWYLKTGRQMSAIEAALRPGVEAIWRDHDFTTESLVWVSRERWAAHGR